MLAWGDDPADPWHRGARPPDPPAEVPRACANPQASAAMARRSRSARQPSSAWIRSDEAISTAGSPGRRAATSTPMPVPVTSAHTSITWRTE